MSPISLDTLTVDLIGQVRLVRTFLRHLRDGGWVRIELVASEGAIQPYDDGIPAPARRPACSP